MGRLARFLTTFVALAGLTAGLAVTAEAATPTTGAEVISFTTGIEGANPCTGESFTGQATYHFAIVTVTSPNGAVSHHIGIATSTFKGVSASGAPYVGMSSTANQETTVTYGPNFEELLSTAMEREVRTGENGTADDFAFRSVIGLKIDPVTGQWTQVHAPVDEFVCN